MDWTGGTRRRFAAGRNNTTVQKQKAYFAKARATWHSTNSSHRTFRPSFPRQGGSTARRDGHSHISASRGLSNASEQTEVKHGQSHSSRAPQEVRATFERVEQAARSPFSSRPSPARAVRRTALKHELQTQSSVTDEERLLLGRRRHLLARTDWLDLNIIRPVQIDFVSTSDKERIGKRRKVKHADRRRALETAEDTEFAPLKPLRPESGMSEATDMDRVQVKIGTDALASHTQRSRPSHNSAHTSMRQPSTDVVLLSEESMLLGSDGDPFEVSATRHVLSHHSDDHDLDCAAQASLLPNGVFHEQHIPQKAQMVQAWSPSSLDAVLQQDRNIARLFDYHADDRNAMEEGMHNEKSMADIDTPPNGRSVVDDSFIQPATKFQPYDESVQRRPLQELNSNSPYVAPYDFENASNPLGNSSDCEDEDAWRRFINIKDESSGHRSMAAVKSSSLHVTESVGSERRLIAPFQPDSEIHARSFSTPKGAGTQHAMLMTSAEGVDSHATIEMSPAPQSPSMSLLRIRNLAQLPEPSAIQPAAVPDDNEIWKSFIIGSQDSSDSSFLLEEARTREDSTTGGVVPYDDHPPSPTISGLGTSIIATQGGTLTVCNRVSKKEAAPYGYQEEPPPVFTSQAQGLSDKLPATRPTARKESTATGSSSQHDRQVSRFNIHASSTPAANAQKARGRRASPRQTKSKQLPAQNMSRKTTAKLHSVYDLVDSDGRSLA